MKFMRFLWILPVICSVMIFAWNQRVARAAIADGLHLTIIGSNTPNVLVNHAANTELQAFIYDSQEREETPQDTTWQWEIVGLYLLGDEYDEVWTGETDYLTDDGVDIGFSDSTSQNPTLSSTMQDFGHWAVVVRCYATFPDESWIQGDDYYVYFAACAANVEVSKKGLDSWDSSQEIAAGGLGSNVHKADIRISLYPNGVQVDDVPLVVEGGDGVEVSSSLSIAGHTIGPGQSASISVNGQVSGTLTSSDVMDGVSISVDDSWVDVDFVWSNYDEDDAWLPDPDYIVPGGYSIQTVILKLDGVPLDNHVLHFYVDEIQYIDENNDVITVDYDSAHPYALDDWAYFDDYEQTTDEYGEAAAELDIQDDPSLIYIHMILYDENVNENP